MKCLLTLILLGVAICSYGQVDTILVVPKQIIIGVDTPKTFGIRCYTGPIEIYSNNKQRYFSLGMKGITSVNDSTGEVAVRDSLGIWKIKNGPRALEVLYNLLQNQYNTTAPILERLNTPMNCTIYKRKKHKH